MAAMISLRGTSVNSVQRFFFVGVALALAAAGRFNAFLAACSAFVFSFRFPIAAMIVNANSSSSLSNALFGVAPSTCVVQSSYEKQATDKGAVI